MPQMFPMNWFMLFMLFSLSFLLMMIMNYFMLYQPKLNKSFNKHSYYQNWLW